MQALGQARFPLRARLQTLDGVAPVQDRLEPLFPYMAQQQVAQVALLIGPAGGAAAEGETARTWRFSDDAGWTLIVAPDSATLSVGPEYGQFDEFVTRFRAILDVLSEAGSVTRCERLGLRYLNIAEVPPGDQRAWRQWFRSELTGWIATDLLAGNTRLVTSITQTQLAVPPEGELSGPPVDIQAIVRHGFIPADTTVPGVLPTQIRNPGYLLDIDLFVDAPQPFDAEELARQVTMLHDQIDRFFHWTLTPDGAAYFGFEEVG